MTKKRVEINEIDFEVNNGWTTFTSKNDMCEVTMRMQNSDIIKIAKLIAARDDDP